MSALHLSILSPERRLIENVAVDEVTLPGSEGQIQILDGHAEMVGTLETGIFHYRNSHGQQGVGAISSGFFEVKNDRVTVLAETVELKNEIDVDRARRSQKVAEDALREADLDEHQFKLYQAQLRRAVARLQLAGHAHL